MLFKCPHTPHTLKKILKKKKWWEAHIRHKKPEVRLFHVLRDGNNQFVTRADWKKRLAVLLDTHPGLEFLKVLATYVSAY